MDTIIKARTVVAELAPQLTELATITQESDCSRLGQADVLEEPAHRPELRIPVVHHFLG